MATLLLGTVFPWTGCQDSGRYPTGLYFIEAQASTEVPRYEVLELSFQHNGAYHNNFFDVDIEAAFKSPGGVEHRVKGFFYGQDLWKLRFRPDEAGTWTYSYTFTGTGGFRRQGTGVFRCLPSNGSGPIQRSPDNPFRWVFADGEPYFPIGLQDCI